MNLPSAVRTIRWMVRDTFRQSLATKLFWVMLAMTAVATLVCASVRVSGDMVRVTEEGTPPLYIPKSEADRLGAKKIQEDEKLPVVSGTVSLGFGLIRFDVGKHREDAVRYIQIWLAGALADTAGVLLALLWTAGFLPTFLEPQNAAVLLAKPAPRWTILVGKYLGVLLFVGVQAILFVAGTWLALGLSTGVWNGTYWLAVPLLVLNFSVFYAVSAFLAVWTRSTVACIFGTLLFWLVCWAINFTHLRLAAVPLPHVSPLSLWLFDIGYWVLPKPLDLGAIFYDAMRAEGFSLKIPELAAAQDAGILKPELSVATSVAFAALTVAAAANEFRTTDY